MDVQNILVPIDYSGDSQKALQWGASLAEKYGAKLPLLHVIPKSVEEVISEGGAFVSPTSSFHEVRAPGTQSFRRHPIIIDLVDKAYTELHDFADKHLKDVLPVQVKVAVGRPAEEILRVAGEEKSISSSWGPTATVAYGTFCSAASRTRSPAMPPVQCSLCASGSKPHLRSMSGQQMSVGQADR